MLYIYIFWIQLYSVVVLYYYNVYNYARELDKTVVSSISGKRSFSRNAVFISHYYRAIFKAYVSTTLKYLRHNEAFNDRIHRYYSITSGKSYNNYYYYRDWPINIITYTSWFPVLIGCGIPLNRKRRGYPLVGKLNSRMRIYGYHLKYYV